MIVRMVEPTDMDEIRRIHDTYHSDFEFPDFRRMYNPFVIEFGQDIVLAGGFEPVLEGTLVTNANPDISRMKIGRALIEAKRIAEMTCKQTRIRDIYAFVNNDDYASHLKQHGFLDCHRALQMRVK